MPKSRVEVRWVQAASQRAPGTCRRVLARGTSTGSPLSSQPRQLAGSNRRRSQESGLRFGCCRTGSAAFDSGGSAVGSVCGDGSSSRGTDSWVSGSGSSCCGAVEGFKGVDGAVSGCTGFIVAGCGAGAGSAVSKFSTWSSSGAVRTGTGSGVTACAAGCGCRRVAVGLTGS